MSLNFGQIGPPTTELAALVRMLAPWTQVSDRCPLGYLFIYPTARIRVCETKFVSTGENRGKTLSSGKKIRSYNEKINYPLFLLLLSFVFQIQGFKRQSCSSAKAHAFPEIGDSYSIT